MKRLFRFFLLLFFTWLLACCVFAQEEAPTEVFELPNDLTGRSIMERLWAKRIPDADFSVHFELIDCGKPCVDFTAEGVLDYTYRFAHSCWAGYCEGSGGFHLKEAQDFMGDNGTLRLRIFVFLNSDGIACKCTLTEYTREDGTPWGHSWGISPIGDDPVNRNVRYRFESYAPPEQPPTEPEDAAVLLTLGSDDQTGAEYAPSEALQISDVRRWTYCSSDERVLWSVELRGSFADAQCLEADGEVWIYDESWRCVETRYYVRDGCAVASVTLWRSTLGIPVAVRSYEFCLPPPERAAPSG